MSASSLQAGDLFDPVRVLADPGIDRGEAGAVGGTTRRHSGYDELAVLLAAQRAAAVALVETRTSSS